VSGQPRAGAPVAGAAGRAGAAAAAAAPPAPAPLPRQGRPHSPPPPSPLPPPPDRVHHRPSPLAPSEIRQLVVSAKVEPEFAFVNAAAVRQGGGGGRGGGRAAGLLEGATLEGRAS
jgi:hypothetical protein